KAQNLSEQKLQNQQEMIGALFLNIVLTGEFQSEFSIFAMEKRYDVVLENPYYVIAVLSVREEKTETDTICAKLMHWCEDAGHDALVSYLHHKYVILLNIDEKTQSKDVLALMRQMTKELFENERAHVALGQIYDSLVQISLSYSQALTALRHTDLTQHNTVCAYNSLMESTAVQDTLNIAVFEAFGSALHQNKFVTAQETLPALFEQYFGADDSAEIRRIKFASVQNLLLDALHKARQTNTITREVYRTGEILCCGTLAELQASAKKLLQLLCAPLQGDVDAEISVAERAKRIIQRDFIDPMLGLYMISDELKVSNSYLSTTFKNKFGTGVVQYINQLRIDQAKDLICNTDMNIK
ncbi:MAG: hypothetical protein RR937_09520, partial [Ruthenibacterium sp.]